MSHKDLVKWLRSEQSIGPWFLLVRDKDFVGGACLIEDLDSPEFKRITATVFAAGLQFRLRKISRSDGVPIQAIDTKMAFAKFLQDNEGVPL